MLFYFHYSYMHGPDKNQSRHAPKKLGYEFWNGVCILCSNILPKRVDNPSKGMSIGFNIDWSYHHGFNIPIFCDRLKNDSPIIWSK